MTERERLEKILLKMPIYEFVRYGEASKLADYLLDNGIIVPPSYIFSVLVVDTQTGEMIGGFIQCVVMAVLPGG